jgi:crotonobetainyl-CoA:carnitine CoA-transferase CaiB-like acyl-CoA transferase
MSEPNRPGALSGLKVVDLSRVLAGPYCAQILADHGADVIKVEPPAGDETRDWGPPFREGDAAFYLSVNRNKRTISLDLTQEEGRAVLLRMLQDADVVVENFKAGTMERWGLGYEVLHARFPRLVHCTITGFGVDGPWGAMPGYDLFVQAWSGLISLNGSPESGPNRLGLPFVDLATGMNAAMGVTLALKQRGDTGLGQHVEVALFDTALSALIPAAQLYFISGQSPGLTGNTHGSISPYSLHRTSGRSIFLSAGSNRMFAGLCRVLGKPHLSDDPRFLTNADRVANRADLTAELEGCMEGQDGEALALELMRNGVGAGAVFSVGDALDHPHAQHRNMVVELDGYRGVGQPIRLSDAPAAIHSAPPRFAQHNDDILHELGFTAEEVTRLYDAGAVARCRAKH